jgi:hypothetical protein
MIMPELPKVNPHDCGKPYVPVLRANGEQSRPHDPPAEETRGDAYGEQKANLLPFALWSSERAQLR